jgi:hypothetical protein|tara:strand:- start:15123 stop:15908 length:786 start_codon:yes stop_codon:yes gene_type:complete
MHKLSQRELLIEGAIRDWKPGKGQLRKGIGSLVKGGLKKGAQAVGAAGKAIKTASERGVKTTWTDVGKGAAAGYEATGDFLTSKRAKLDKFLDELGLMPADGERSFRGKKKLAVVDVVQYDYDEAGNKIPMPGGKVETRKFKYKDDRWQRVTDKQRREHAYGVEIPRGDLAEADKRHPLAGKIVKHSTTKGGVVYGTVVAVTDDDYAAIKPHKGSKAPGLYGKAVDEVEETTEEEAKAHYGIKTEGTSQKDLLRQLTLLSD